MTNVTEKPVLLERYFNYIDSNTCRKIKTEGFNQYVTFDKFCVETQFDNTNLASDRIDKGIEFTVILFLFFVCVCVHSFSCVRVTFEG